MECKNCKYRKICKDLLLEGFDDLSCDDVAKIAKEEVRDEEIRP